MKTVYVKNLAGDVASISYEDGDIYEALMRSYPIPEKHMVKLFGEGWELCHEPMDGEVVSIFCQEFRVEIYESGLAIDSWSEPYYRRYDIRIRSDDQKRFGTSVFSFYHRGGEWVPSSAVTIQSHYMDDEERIVITDKAKCSSTPEELFRTSLEDLESWNPISRNILYENILYEWRNGTKKNYGVIPLLGTIRYQK